MTEFITRHDDILTIVQVVDDPIYLDEPYVLSITYTYDPNAGPATENCSGSSFAENGGRDRHWVPHFLPGQNSGIGEFLKTQTWIPFEPVRGGVKTIYPEYRAVMSKPGDGQQPHRAGVEVGQRRREADCRSEPARRPGPRAAGAGQHLHARRRRDEHHRVGRQGRHRGRQHRLGADDGQGAGGARTSWRRRPSARRRPTPASAPTVPGMPSWSSPYFNTVVASPRPAQPIRYIINTSAAPEHVGGNEKLAASARFRRAGGQSGFGGAVRDVGETATIVAHDGVLTAMSTPARQDPGRSRRRLAGRHVLRRLPQTVRVRERRAGHPLPRARRPTPTATASCSSATRRSSAPATSSRRSAIR